MNTSQPLNKNGGRRGENEWAVLDLGATRIGNERWEMFPSPAEQDRLRRVSAPDLARALWRSGSFVFGSGIIEIGRNVSVEKAIHVVEETLKQKPELRDGILESLRGVVSDLEPWCEMNEVSQRAGYLPEHVERHKQLRVELLKLIAD